MLDYTTVKEPFRCSFTEKKSEFITDIAHAPSPDAASAFIAAVRAEHKKASHVVYGYVTNEGGTSFNKFSDESSADGDISGKIALQSSRGQTFSKFSDDGEPSGTAGKPVFDVLTANGLSDTVITVTRYFGGILLGGGGLTRAYSRAAADGCRGVKRLVMRVCKPMSVTVPYNLYGKIAVFLAAETAANTLRYDEPTFTENVTVTMRVLAAHAPEIKAKFTDLTNGAAQFVEYDETFAEFA
jgi:putative IMPACT (imprinted ancient) family translation regulator